MPKNPKYLQSNRDSAQRMRDRKAKTLKSQETQACALRRALPGDKTHLSAILKQIQDLESELAKQKAWESYHQRHLNLINRAITLLTPYLDKGIQPSKLKEEKRNQRALSNAEAARRSSLRKSLHQETLEAEIEILEKKDPTLLSEYYNARIQCLKLAIKEKATFRFSEKSFNSRKKTWENLSAELSNLPLISTAISEDNPPSTSGTVTSETISEEDLTSAHSDRESPSPLPFFTKDLRRMSSPISCSDHSDCSDTDGFDVFKRTRVTKRPYEDDYDHENDYDWN